MSCDERARPESGATERAPQAHGKDDASPEGERQPDVVAPEGVGGRRRQADPGLGPAALRPFGVSLLAFFVLGMGTAAVVAMGTVAGVESPYFPLLAQGLASLPASLAVLAGWILLDRRGPRALGYVPGARRVVAGLLGGTGAGMLAMVAVTTVGVALGGYQVRAPNDPAAAWGALLWAGPLLLAAHFEEVLARGSMLQDWGRRWTFVGLAASSLIFALLHLANPELGSGPVRYVLSLNLALAGAWLGCCFLRTGDLWLPTGVHFGWNWCQGLVLGMPVSGFDLPSAVDGHLVGEPSVLFGNDFGPESSLLTTVLLTALVVEGVVAVMRRRARGPLHEQAAVPEAPPATEAAPTAPSA